ncbi:MAG: membrane complex biogenesis BtpA family protein [Kiritimatiellia bacterium]|jgi:membrane complex biogenesis BtpA family protein
MSAWMFHPGRPAVVGMVHLLPLPGSSEWAGDIGLIMERAVADAEALRLGGADAVLIENMHDLPYLKGRVHPETVAAFAVVGAQVARVGLPMGVQVLAGANRQALGIALAIGARFVRVEGFAYAHVADEGWIDACAGPLLRARAAMSARGVQIWADVQKKHSAHAVTSDLSVSELARGAAFCGADAVIVTGPETGMATDPEVVRGAQSSGLPVVVGSGVTPDGVASIAAADALIVGSWIKHDGDWRAPVDPRRVAQLCAVSADARG